MTKCNAYITLSVSGSRVRNALATRVAGVLRFTARAAGSVVLAAMAFLSAPGPATVAAQPAPLTGLDDYITAAMEAWQVPGLAIAIVHDGRTAYERGYGVRDVTTGEPVDQHTLFAVGSTSKAFTSAALGILVDEGRVRWDDRVIDHIPWFEMYDAYATRELTVRDLLTHRSGLARGDAVWSRWPHDRREIIRRVRYLKPTRSFRGAWQYQNLMFLTAGEVVRAASGKSWDDFVAERIFAPLGMTRSVTSVTELPRLDNVASPHVPVDGVPTPVPHKNIDNVGPAGSIYSSASQMARWVALHLESGVHEGQRLVSDGTMAEMHYPQMAIQADAPENRLHSRDAVMNFNAYALAWWVLDYRGRKVVDHGGGIDGMRAHVAFMPEEGIGMVALSNARPNNLIVALMYRVFDHFLDGGAGADAADWSTLMLAEMREGEARQAEARRELAANRASGTSPSRPLPEYAGTYEEQYHGAVDILHGDDGLRLSLGGKTTGRLEHWHYDVFRMVPDNPANGEMFATFTLGADGVVGTLDFGGLGTFARR